MPKIESSLREIILEAIDPDERLYAVVDSARAPYLALVPRTELAMETRTLFQGEMAPFLDHVAPHLVCIPKDSLYLGLWTEKWGSCAGILLITREQPEVLYRHLRSIYVVCDEEENEYFFRYFDPRVLRVYLPTCTREEARELFGPIRCILVEAEMPGNVLCCSLDATGLNVSETTPGSRLQSRSEDAYVTYTEPANGNVPSAHAPAV